MPVWGLSALAAGSISAYLSDAGQAEVTPWAATALPDDGLWQGSSNLSLMTPSAEPKILRNSSRSGAKAAGAHGMKTQSVHKVRLADLPGIGSTVANAVMGISAVPASVSVAAVKTAIDVPTPATVANGRVVGIVDVLQVAPKNAPTNLSAAASVALPKISSVAPAARSEQARSRAIYGTSANNAYKVYFPQAEHTAPARGNDLDQALITSAEQDGRVLTKQGSYLFYEDQSEQAGTGKINEILKANGAGSGKSVVDAIINAGKNAEARELTAPVLQKQPLNFGGPSLEGSLPKGNATPKIPIGESNAG